MNGGLTWQEMDVRKLKERNLDAALDYLKGRMDSEKLMAVDRILRSGLGAATDTPTPPRSSDPTDDGEVRPKKEGNDAS